MLLSLDQLKHLEPDGEEKYKFVDDGSVTDKEKAKILEMDADFFEVYGEHIITNLEELK